MKGFLFFFSFIVVCICLNAQVIDQPYNYPVKRHSTAWDSIKGYQNLRSACQIPSQIVNRMTTEALFESVLNYPLVGDAFVFSSFEKGVETLKRNFAAFDSLINRGDFGKVLIKIYSSYSAKKLENKSDIDKGEHSVKTSFLELIASEAISNKKNSSSELKELINAFVVNYYAKRNKPEIYGTISLSTCVWALNKILILNNADDKFTIRDKYVQEGNVFSEDILKSIVNNAKLYIESLSN